MSSSDKASKSLKTALTASYAAVYRPGRVFIAYALIASFWFAFGQIYEYFGHGVTTPFMHLAFLIPLCMGLVPAVIFLITGKKIAPGRFSRSFWRWACACFTGGSVLKGENSLDGALRETREEVGLTLSPDAGRVIRSAVRKEEGGRRFSDIVDVWLFAYDGPVDLKLATTREVAQVLWMDRDRIRDLYEKGDLVDTLGYFFEIEGV